jgi:hypothetical protein
MWSRHEKISCGGMREQGEDEIVKKFEVEKRRTVVEI